MLSQTSPMSQPAMASSAKADSSHSGSNGGIDAGPTVLDDKAAVRHRRQPLRGIEEKIRRRLATRNHRRAKQVFTKMLVETGEFEFSADLLRCAARCNANGQLQPIEGLANSLNRSQRLAKPVLDHRSDTLAI